MAASVLWVWSHVLLLFKMPGLGQLGTPQQVPRVRPACLESVQSTWHQLLYKPRTCPSAALVRMISASTRASTPLGRAGQSRTRRDRLAVHARARTGRPHLPLGRRRAHDLGLHERVKAVEAEPVELGVAPPAAAAAPPRLLALQLAQQLLRLRGDAAGQGGCQIWIRCVASEEQLSVPARVSSTSGLSKKARMPQRHHEPCC